MCLGYLLALAEMKVLLACVARKGRLHLLRPEEETWQLFPLARPRLGLPARLVPTPAA